MTGLVMIFGSRSITLGLSINSSFISYNTGSALSRKISLYAVGKNDFHR